MAPGGPENEARQSIESGSDELSTIPAVESPSSSSMAPESPEIEVVAINEDGEEFASRSPPLAIIDEDELFVDPILSFPYNGDGESLVNTVKRLAHFIQFEPIEDDACFCKLRDWIESYLAFTRDRADGWYESYSKYRAFWNAFPEVVWALSWRSRFFTEFLDRSREGYPALTGFLAQFSRLAGRFVAMDVRMLAGPVKRNGDDEYPDLPSRGYLLAFSYLLRKEEPGHIGKNLETHYNWAWDEEIPMWLASFQNGGGSLSNLAKLAEEQVNLVPQLPKLVDNLSEPCRLITRILSEATNPVGEGVHHLMQPADPSRQQLARAHDFFKVMSAGLVSIIEEHVASLSPDSAQTIVNSLTSTLYTTLLYENSATRDLIAAKRDKHPEIPARYAPKAISFEWKFTILRMLITSTQMQLRVVGVTTMCTDLLALHNVHKNDVSQNSLLLFLADFVIRNKIMEYLVGIASHPEIINESYNILGFLIVTNTYDPTLVSTIWKTVTTSQDPRVVEAILRMLQRCFHLQRYDDLVYLCKMAGSFPIDSFTVAMRDFCDELLRILIDKAVFEGVQKIDAPPYLMCTWLLRESSKAGPDPPAGYLDIQNFATARLRDLAGRGPSDHIRDEIYLECILDVSSKSVTAPGSICVINGLLREKMETDLRKLTTEHCLTSLVIQELGCTVAEDRLTFNQSVRNSPINVARRELLLNIILKEPGTLTTELGTKLWNLLVGCESKSVIDRNTSWQILNNAVKKSSVNNEFIAACFKTHLPALPPDCFTLGSLEFARAALSAWLEEIRKDFIHEDLDFESPALDQLWRMILIALPNSIDAQAIHTLVEVYVDSGLILSLPRVKARNIHLALVNRCLGQLASAAAKLKSFDLHSNSNGGDTDMTGVASEAEFQEQEVMFARSLAVLREFLRAYQSKPQFTTPKSRPTLSGPANAVEGEPITVKYQSFDGGKQTEVMTLTLGKLNTAASLVSSLQRATGFKSFRLYYGGKGFDPDEIEVSKSLEDLNLNGLVLVQKRNEEDVPGLIPGTRTSLEIEITKHMDELWGYLGMHDKVAQEIYSFLIKFPVYDVLLANFESEDVSYKEVFPLGRPFKSLYAIYALREYIRTQLQHGTVNEGALTRSTKLIVSALSDPDVLKQCPEGELRDSLALHLIDSLVMFLKEPILPTSIETLLNGTLLQRLLELLNCAKSVVTSHNSVHLTWRCMEVILEGCLYNPALWSSFKSHLASSSLLQELLLEDSRQIIRKSVAKQIMAKCTFNPTLARVSTTEFSVAFWPMIVDLILQANQHTQRCEELFNLALALFKRIAETSLEFINLEDVARQWTSLLLYGQGSKDNAGRLEGLDTLIQGLANLCYTATSFAKASQQTLACSDMGVKLFRKHLFPDLSADDIADLDRAIVPNFPCLNPTTRHVISETIFHLVKDDEEEYKDVLLHLSALVPYEITELGPYVYELPFLFERGKSIRSPTGYVGLRNLSNTCYLNSLFTQLFMNIPFREFMLNATVADPGGSQKLLAETQNLFSYMQNSLRRFVDPSNLAGSIRTYDEAGIDVTVQMDVDEFYNLLFDRWEGQILATDSKMRFRSFFGGQLVQQVKSKECPHISERLEDFSAIQCEIKGKTSLQESLQAYVDGEILAGENKYNCSTCNRHVDAVKRACLKNIPDNLIFHLKRFDFNLRNLQRSKINDYFSFPEKVDMRPYKVEHLMNSQDECPEDIFELVGILVHSGTAESGHYYSYIRERPSNGAGENWIEFNDDNVSSWDPKCMESACFGGLDYRGTVENGNVQFDKSYSAYMLFYQRSSYLAAQKQELEKSGMPSPIRLPLTPRLSNHIAMENELLLRKHCLYDPSHATFVGKMLSNIKHINKGCCSDAHSLEKLALIVALNHLDQVVARTKDLPDFPNFILGVRQMCNNCAECSRDFLEWFSDRPECLRHLLLRNPEMLVRSEMASSILQALVKVKADAAYAYGLSEDEDSSGDLDTYEDPRLLQRVIRATMKLWDMFHTNCRAWPEYFGLLLSIASLGDHEAALLVDAGYLRKTLEVITADNQLPLSNQYQRMLNIVSKRVATRPVSYDSLIGLLYKLLSVCDFSAEPVEDIEERLESSLSGGTLPLNNSERHLLMQHWTRSQSHILTEKLLQIHQNYMATRNILIALLSLQDSLDHHILQAIITGIKRGTATAPSGPFLKAAITYCEYSEEPDAIPNMVSRVTEFARQIDNLEGKEFLQFYTELLDLEDNRSRIPRESILLICLEQVQDWSPPLLNYYDNAVRDGMESFLTEHVLGYGPQVEFGPSPVEIEKTNAIIATAQRIGTGCLEYLNDTYVKVRQPAVRAFLENILSVIEICTTFFDEEAEDNTTIRFFELRSIVIPALTKITVEELDDDPSEWENSEGDYGSSEPMDSIAELCVGISDELDGGAALQA